jgi:hypothetical protein
MHPTTEMVHLHSTLLRFVYRILTPRSPRGWIDFHAVQEGDLAKNFLWIHTHGMERWNLPNLEIVNVPYDLRGPAHGLLCELLDYMKSAKAMKPDENFGGQFVGGEQQTAWHVGTTRNAPSRDPLHTGFLRIVDYGESSTSGFPFKLFAAHLCALAGVSRNPRKREELYRRAIEIFPGGFLSEGEGVSAETGRIDLQTLQLKTNIAGWEGLANTLADQGRNEEAIACLEQAIARCPSWGRDFAKFVKDSVEGGFSDNPEHPLARFWNHVDVDSVRLKITDPVQAGVF